MDEVILKYECDIKLWELVKESELDFTFETRMNNERVIEFLQAELGDLENKLRDKFDGEGL